MFVLQQKKDLWLNQRYICKNKYTPQVYYPVTPPPQGPQKSSRRPSNSLSPRVLTELLFASSKWGLTIRLRIRWGWQGMTIRLRIYDDTPLVILDKLFLLIALTHPPPPRTACPPFSTPWSMDWWRCLSFCFRRTLQHRRKAMLGGGGAFSWYLPFSDCFWEQQNTNIVVTNCDSVNKVNIVPRKVSASLTPFITMSLTQWELVTSRAD
mgnify:CR=1 FL=1